MTLGNSVKVYTDEPKHYDHPFLMCCWSFVCHQDSSDSPKHGLQKTSEGVLWHGTDLFQHIPSTPVHGLFLPGLLLIGHSLLLSGTTPQAWPSQKCFESVNRLQESGPCQNCSGFYTCPFFEHPTHLLSGPTVHLPSIISTIPYILVTRLFASSMRGHNVLALQCKKNRHINKMEINECNS